MPAFDINIVHWRSIAEFSNALKTIKRPSWVKGITCHNTYRPNEDTWRGMASMLSMRDTYIAKGWSSGPNLYLCAEAPNPLDTGIWQMTPIARPGTHAGACNSSHLGIESVGDFDRAPPSADQYTLLIAVNLLIMQAWGLPPESVNVHRDCMPGRTCPGKYLTSEQIRASLNTKPPKPPDTTRIAHAGPFGAIARQDYMAAAKASAYFPPGAAIEIDDFAKNSYRHTKSGIGFIADGDLVLV